MQRTLEDLDRDRAAVGGADEPVDDLERAAAAVARVAEPRQRARAALEVGGGDVVEDERRAGEMTARERLLDPPLAGKQPVERRVQLVLVRPLDRQLARERRL